MKFKLVWLVLLVILSSKAFAADYSPTECPVVGNTESKIFHVPGGKSYAKMLRKNKEGDNRKCFKTESEALGAGYRKAKR